DYATLAQAVRKGMGIGELPAILSTERVSLVHILPEWTLGDVALQLLFPADRLLSRTRGDRRHRGEGAWGVAEKRASRCQLIVRVRDDVLNVLGCSARTSGTASDDC